MLTDSPLHERLSTYVTPAAVGVHQYLALPALIRIFQEAALRNTDRLDISSSSLIERYQLTWVLHRQLITASQWPKMGDAVEVITAPTRIERGLLTYRDFHLLNETGQALISATTAWTLMHIQSRRIKPIPDTISKRLTDWPAPQDNLPKPDGKLQLPSSDEANALPFRVSFAQLDFNRHLTNPSYPELLLEPLGMDHLSRYLPTRVDIEYRKEARYADELLASSAPTGTPPLPSATGFRDRRIPLR